MAPGITPALSAFSLAQGFSGSAVTSRRLRPTSSYATIGLDTPGLCARQFALRCDLLAHRVPRSLALLIREHVTVKS